MDLTAQAKVLRALQNGEVVRVGSEHVINVDVRVLAATNKDLAKAVQGGTFREDLFFRLDVLPIRAPALRERKIDITTLAEAFVQVRFLQGKRPAFEEDRPERVPTRWRAAKWPGNVRELKNVMSARLSCPAAT